MNSYEEKYFNTLYNNPKFVSSEIQNEQIVIDAIASNYMVLIYNWAGKNQWVLNYKFDFQFKDNKIKFTPMFKHLENEEYKEISLIGDKIMGINSGMFTKKGKVTVKKGVERVEEYVNTYFETFKTAMLKEDIKNDNW